MFRSLPGADFPREDLLALGSEMVAAADSKPRESSIPAGYTYLGQFIDHDLTFDPVSTLQRADDPEGLVDYRTPRFDLDSLYGRGPNDQPYLYERDGVRLALGAPLIKPDSAGDIPDGYDVPRTDGTELAIIGDPRNDENVIIAQLHSIFMRFHNRIARDLKAQPGDVEKVQQLVRWHYQWVILYDFLPRVVESDTYRSVLPHAEGKIKQKEDAQPDMAAPIVPKSDVIQHPPRLRFYRAQHEAFIPIEFSGAGYRFGHSLVRPDYSLNLDPQLGRPMPIVGDDPSASLGGFRRFQSNWLIDWRLFYPIDGIHPRLQRTLKIDTKLANPLADLPFAFLKPIVSLPQRNLIRGLELGLPSAQAIAQAMGIQPLDDDQLRVGADPLGKFRDGAFREQAPLWYYLLGEAQHLHDGEKLGSVGSCIVMETFLGLLMADGHSLLRQNPLWKPDIVEQGGSFGMAEFVKMAIEPLH
jgi:hypothetical protein